MVTFNFVGLHGFTLKSLFARKPVGCCYKVLTVLPIYVRKEAQSGLRARMRMDTVVHLSVKRTRRYVNV